jgi:hypothetical protein
MDAAHKSVDAVVQPVESEHPTGEFQMILSNAATDRDGESLRPDQWQLPLPAKIHLDSDHAWSKGLSVPLTVGSGVPSIAPNGDLVVKGSYASTDHGQLVRRLVNEGHVWQASVSYINHKTRAGVKREILNGTFTGVPTNPGAVVLSSKSVGDAVADAVEEMEITMPETEPRGSIADVEKKALESEFASKMFRGELSEGEAAAFKDRWEKADVASKNIAVANSFAGCADQYTGDPRQFNAQPETPDGYNEGICQKKWTAANPLFLNASDLQQLHEAGRRHTRYGVMVAPPGMDVDNVPNESHLWLSKDFCHRPAYSQKDMAAMQRADVRSKANPSPAAEGAIGTEIPAQLLSTGFPLRIDPLRIFELFPGAAAGGQGVTFLTHTGNTNPAAAVAELGLKPDLAPIITPTTITFTTVAATLSVSRLFFDDFPTWGNWAPAELYRAVVDAENAQILTGSGSGANMLGLMNQPNTLTRTAALSAGPPSVTEIDVLRSACMDLRNGPEYCVADLIILNVIDWDYISKLKTTQNQYVLSAVTPNDIGFVDNLFGVRVVTSTKMPQGKALVADTRIACLSWTRLGMEILANQYDTYDFFQNAWTFRGEERIAVGVQYPKALNIVSGLNPSFGS